MTSRATIARGAAVLLSSVFVGLASLLPAARAADCPPHLREDALLRDVFFLDAETGWAVGDRGAVWRTDDGGRSWRLQNTGVDCPLYCAQFISHETGWVAGGDTAPNTLSSRGVLLMTRDGGRTWTPQAKLLPTIRKFRMFDDRHGWAIGEPSPLYPSGVLSTDDAGRTWKAVSAGDVKGWLTGDFLDPLTGALAGRQGALAAVQNRTLRPAASPGFGLRGLHQMRLTPEGGGWLVGDGGLILTTVSGGRSWQLPAGPLPDDSAGHFDFQAVAAVGPHCWVAGSPGTRVFYSPDTGRSWQAFATRQNVPIHALYFRDAERGWGVGAMGTILSTFDGGKSWQRQRSGGTRAAVLGLFGEPDSAPWECFADACGNEGHLGVIVSIARRDADQGPVSRISDDTRLHEAALAMGASAADVAWQFPARQAGVVLRGEQLLAGWDRANDGRGGERLEAHLVRTIRTWRPDVIVTHGVSASGDDPLAHAINQAVLSAVEVAADPTRLTEQAVQAGLEPWQVKKVFSVLKPGEQGTVNISTAQLAAHLGASLREAAQPARGLFPDAAQDAPASWGLRLSLSELPADVAERGLMAGVSLQPGGEARRRLPDFSEGVEARLQAAQRQRNAQAIIEQAERGGDDALLLAQVGDLTRGLEGPLAGRLLFELARRYHRGGRGELAAETLDLLAKQHPDHPLAPAAATWLVQYHASAEAAWRRRSGQRVTLQAAAAVIDPARPFDEVVPASSGFAIGRETPVVAEGPEQDQGADIAANWGQWLERSQPAVAAEPSVQFPLAVADIRRGLPKQAERYYLLQSRSRPDDAWRRCAAGEVWLKDKSTQPPRETLRCGLFPTADGGNKPHLDGKLDDDIWRSAKAAALVSRVDDASAWPGSVRIARDEEFLYVGITCRKAPGGEYAAASGPRPSDADLRRRDRVELLLDVDRDYATYYKLAVDHRGFVHDECWGDASWNPSWYVAAGGDDKEWTVEAAIPFDQLVQSPPVGGAAWAIGIQRTAPGAGFQSWTAPASTAVQPEGFGWLLFE